jgi:hypothetical protein
MARNATKFRELGRAKRLALREPERSEGARLVVEAASGRATSRCALRAQAPERSVGDGGYGDFVDLPSMMVFHLVPSSDVSHLNV